MKKCALFFFLVLPFFVSCATTTGKETPENQADAHYKIGWSYINSNKIQQAFVEFHKAYELDPGNKLVLNSIGIVYLQYLDEPKKAIEYFEKAAKVDPNYSEVYNNLGYAYYELHDYERAISYYQKALSNPTYPTAEKAYYNLGVSYYRLGKYDAALQAFKDALKREPNLGPVYLSMALCLNAMGKYGDASAAMTQAVNLNPAYQGDKEKAAEDWHLRKLRATGNEEKDLSDYLEILKY